MLDIQSCLKQLEKIKKPEAMLESTVLLTKEVPLRLNSLGKAEDLFPISKVLFKITKPPRRQQIKNVWEADIKNSGPGYFDVSGNFILDKPKKITVTWLLKKNDAIEGPFSEKELNQFLAVEPLEGYWIKRDLDKGFVMLQKLSQDIPDFIHSKELSKYFSQNQKTEEEKKADSFFDVPIFTEKSSRLTNFLRNNEISASVDFIVKTVKGMRKVEAINVLEGVTGLDKNVNTALIDLIVESSGYQILSDVDKDGFYFAKESRRDRRR